MIEYQMAARGLNDAAVLQAMNAVPREEFIPGELVEFAPTDCSEPNYFPTLYSCTDDSPVGIDTP